MEQTKKIAPVGAKETFDISSIEIVDGFVNLTKLAASQGKEIRTWTRLKSSKEFIEAINESTGCQNLETRLGNSTTTEQGTFGTREVALEVARWISPKFAIWCNKQIDNILQNKTLAPASALPKPLGVADILALNTQVINQLQEKINQLQPKAEFTDRVYTAINLISVGEFAKLIGTGPNRLFDWLRVNNFLMYNNTPYQEYIDRGYFEVKERLYQDKYTGETRVSLRTFITGRGQTYLEKKFKGNQDKTSDANNGGLGDFGAYA